MTDGGGAGGPHDRPAPRPVATTTGPGACALEDGQVSPTARSAPRRLRMRCRVKGGGGGETRRQVRALREGARAYLRGRRWGGAGRLTGSCAAQPPLRAGPVGVEPGKRGAAAGLRRGTGAGAEEGFSLLFERSPPCSVRSWLRGRVSGCLFETCLSH